MLINLNRRSLIVACAALIASCAYFNTYYNAQNYYAEAKKTVIHDTLKSNSEFFDKAIEKSTIVIVKHRGCRWVDDALFIMGASYYYRGDYPRAHEKFDFLNINYPQSSFNDDALYYKGLTYFKQNKLSNATLALNEATASKQYRRKSMIALLYVCLKEQKYADLIDRAQNLLNEPLSSQEKKEVLQLLGDAQFQQKQYSGALKTFTDLLRITRTNEDKRMLKLRIAQAYLELAEYESCQDFLAGEGDAEFKYILGDLNLRLGKIDVAKETYLDIIQIGQAEFAAQAYYRLAQIYEEEDSFALAIAYYDSSIAKYPAGKYSAEAKKMSDVLSRILTLSSASDSVDRAKFLIAETYFTDLNLPQEAIRIYQEVYATYPKSSWAPKALYAEFWITKNILKDDTLAFRLAQDLADKYPSTEYAASVANTIQNQ